MSEKDRIPYSKRSDIQKIVSNWQKARGLYKRGDYSAAIVRAVTATELAANFVIREELQKKRKLEAKFVDDLLYWANGLPNKLRNLIIPISRGDDNHRLFASLTDKVRKVSGERNNIVHSGQFKKEQKARATISESKEIIEVLVKAYKPKFSLKDIE
ncbi:MAG: hypothetical protein FJ004_01795 [Chloroflexi bacterium]|nr:hypothetical protein [Chloroflexota bacterium]